MFVWALTFALICVNCSGFTLFYLGFGACVGCVGMLGFVDACRLMLIWFYLSLFVCLLYWWLSYCLNGCNFFVAGCLCYLWNDCLLNALLTGLDVIGLIVLLCFDRFRFLLCLLFRCFVLFVCNLSCFVGVVVCDCWLFAILAVWCYRWLCVVVLVLVVFGCVFGFITLGFSGFWYYLFMFAVFCSCFRFAGFVLVVWFGGWWRFGGFYIALGIVDCWDVCACYYWYFRFCFVLFRFSVVCLLGFV